METSIVMRNPLHNHPLLRKGGTHKKTNAALRQKEKTALKKEWLPQNIFKQYVLENLLFMLPYRINSIRGPNIYIID